MSELKCAQRPESVLLDAVRRQRAHARRYGCSATPSTGSALGRPASCQSTADYRVVMFTDLVNSTSIGVHHGDRTYMRAVKAHEHIVRGVLDRHVGFVFDTAGDGVLAWFRSPETAIRASLRIIDEVAAGVPGLAEVDLAVRIGLADGRPIEHEGALFGTTINLAARVVDRAPSGALLCTQSIQQKAIQQKAIQQETGAGSFRFQPLGGHVLKGFPDPVDLARVESV